MNRSLDAVDYFDAVGSAAKSRANQLWESVGRWDTFDKWTELGHLTYDRIQEGS